MISHGVEVAFSALILPLILYPNTEIPIHRRFEFHRSAIEASLSGELHAKIKRGVWEERLIKRNK